MEEIKKRAEDFVRMCEKRGLAATMAISDPNDTEEKGFVGNTGPIYSVLANIAGILLAIEKDSGAGFGEKFTVKKAPMMPIGLYSYEVIGNIHENPELLGGEE